MEARSRLKRIRRLKGLALALAIAAIAAPAALADPPQTHRAQSTDALDRYVVNNAPNLRPVRLVPDAFDRYATNEATETAVLTEPDPGRPQVAVPATSSLPSSIVIRGDYKTGIRDIPVTSVVVARPDTVGFDWRDAGIGAAGALALALLGASLLIAMRRGRKTGLATA